MSIDWSEPLHGLFQIIPSPWAEPRPLSQAEIAAKVDSEHGWNVPAKVFHVLGQCRVKPTPRDDPAPYRWGGPT